MAGTTAAALKTALKTAMAADVGLVNIPISYGDPGDLGRTEHIWMGAAEEGSSEPTGMRSSRKRREEEYVFDVVVEVSSKARPESNEARAVVLGTIIEELIADDPKISNTTNLLWVMLDSFELDTTELSEGPRTVFTLTLRAKGRLL